jgi:hypothetical protein
MLPAVVSIPSAPCMNRALPFLAAVPLLFLGCDNVGRAFDPVVGGGGGPPTEGLSVIQVVPAGGDVRDGRPRVKNVYPIGGGWPTTVPIVIEFNESMNAASIEASSLTASDAKFYVRVKGTTQAVPAEDDFLAGGRLLILRPTPGLSSSQPSYEIVQRPEARDADGVRFDGTEDKVLGEFQVDEAPEERNGRIVATYPRDNSRDAARETTVVVVFTKAAVPASITETTLLLLDPSGAAVNRRIGYPLRAAPLDETRVVELDPVPTLDAGQHEIEVTNGITFPEGGVLDFSGRTPFARFDTVAPAAPTSVTIVNGSFPDKINTGNVGSVMLDVEVPGSSLAGDRVVARVYGFDSSTTITNDLLFVERSAVVPANGQQQLRLDFGGAFGTVERPKLDDGEIHLAAQLQRGDQHSGFVLHAESSEPRFDLTAPTLAAIGPPAMPEPAVNVLLTDLQQVAVFGTADEGIASANLTVGGTPVDLFARANDGRFLFAPYDLGLDPARREFQLTLTDLAGNSSSGVIPIFVAPRGMLTGTLAGTLTVEAYDDATLQPIAGATVLVDPGTPTMPATGQQNLTTLSDGRASFTTGASTRSTITVVHASYHLTTIYDSAAAFVSVPLRPRASATATLQTTAQTTVPNTHLLGCSAIDDAATTAVLAPSGSPNDVSAIVKPLRPLAVSMFGGTFEPTSQPEFSTQACLLLGTNGVTPTPPLSPIEPGATLSRNVAMLPVAATLTATRGGPKDFGLAVGLDTANLVGSRPLVRVASSLGGFGGQLLTGVGFAELVSGAAFNVESTVAAGMLTGLGGLGPINWLLTEASDTDGRISRHRAGLMPSILPLPILIPQDQLPAPLSIPTITAPAGPFTGSPSVTFDDVLDPAPVTNGVAVVDVLAQDAGARQWRMIVADRDGAGGTDTVQFPDLGTVIVGLRAGSWSMRAEARIFSGSSSSVTADAFVLSERRRMEVGYARSKTEPFQVN